MEHKKEDQVALQNVPWVQRSDITIDREGSWFYRGTEMIRRDIVRFFYQNLIQDETGGYFIRTGPQSYPVRVEDTAYVVRNVRYSAGTDGAEECIHILLSDDRLERLDPETVRIGKNNVLYCRVCEGRFAARFSKPAYYRLADYIRYNAELGSFYLSLNGQSFYVKE